MAKVTVSNTPPYELTNVEYSGTAKLVTAAITDNANPKPGDTVTTAVTVRNNGSAAAFPTVGYAPPPSLTNVEYSTDCGNIWRPWPGSHALGGIPGGSSAKVLIRGKVSPKAAGSLDNTYTVTSSAGDIISEDNTVRTNIPIVSLGAS